MKKILSALLILSLVLLCGCTKGGSEVSAVQEVSAPNGTEFASTTVYEDDSFSFKVVSAARTDSGMSYAVLFQNKTTEALDVTLSNLSVNDGDVLSDVTLTATVEKNDVFPTTLAVPLSADTVAGKISLHLETVPSGRWWAKTTLSRDLIFYPVAQQSPTATATAAQ